MSKLSSETMQNNLAQLIDALSDMTEKKQRIDQEIEDEEQEYVKTENELIILSERLSILEGQLHRQKAEKAELDSTIEESDQTRNKISQSYKQLISLLQKESIHHLHSQPQPQQQQTQYYYK